MASMAATCRLTAKGFESKSLCPRSSSLCPHSLSRFTSYSISKSSSALRCRIPSRNVGILNIRAMCSDSSGPGPKLEDTVKNTIAQNPVVVYSKTWCSYSAEVKSLFKRLDVEPFVIELDQLGAQGPQLQKTLEKLTGQHTVPNVFIGGKHIGGCTDTIKLHQKGELEALLSEAGAKK
ncbi:Thioredoxin superfamily protein [Perilla frutescens var. hirtella]|uniref:Thioredoxin superfamily protein n=1 Tax=Perilla frutescens var. hirtella TaxID=608512 RepID=A0AAD4IYI6_PERFH|nr:Thioredoxin superfamily protein [Perilla frutescens var. hirtella]